MQRKTTSLKIDPKIWKEAKIHCVKKEIKISEYIEKLIQRDMKNNT